jgi:hypothetical protein
MASLEQPSLWRVDVEVLASHHGFSNVWLNFCACARHSSLERIETWGVDEQGAGLRGRAAFLIRATDASGARGVAEQLLEPVVGADAERRARHGRTIPRLSVRPAPPTEGHAEDARPKSREDYESRLVPTPWHRGETVEDGRHVKILSFSGRAPVERVEIMERPDAVTITLLERRPPRFSSDDSPTVTSAVSVVKCVEIALDAPLGERPMIDGATGRPPATIEPGDDGERLSRAQALELDLAALPCATVPAVHH